VSEEESEKIVENLEILGSYPRWQSESALNSLFNWKVEILGCDEEWKNVLTKAWMQLIKWVELDVFNSSSQACDDILTRLGVVKKKADLN